MSPKKYARDFCGTNPATDLQAYPRASWQKYKFYSIYTTIFFNTGYT